MSADMVGRAVEQWGAGVARGPCDAEYEWSAHLPLLVRVSAEMLHPWGASQLQGVLTQGSRWDPGVSLWCLCVFERPVGQLTMTETQRPGHRFVCGGVCGSEAAQARSLAKGARGS